MRAMVALLRSVSLVPSHIAQMVSEYMVWEEKIDGEEDLDVEVFAATMDGPVFENTPFLVFVQVCVPQF